MSRFMVVRLMFTAKKPFHLSPKQRAVWSRWCVRPEWGPAWPAGPARCCFWTGGLSLRRIRVQTGMSPRRILVWKRHWQRNGVDDLLDAPRAGGLRR